jgi:hypothetical protein
VSKAFNIPIPEEHTREERNASKKVKKYTGYRKFNTKAESKNNKDKKKNKKVKFTENS